MAEKFSSKTVFFKWLCVSQNFMVNLWQGIDSPGEAMFV
jgi:hypothetical protein